jgi:hypothetical protein
MPQAKTPQTPPKPPSPGRNGFKYSPRWALVIPCRSEQHQAELYQRFKGEGFAPKVVVV